MHPSRWFHWIDLFAIASLVLVALVVVMGPSWCPCGYRVPEGGFHQCSFGTMGVIYYTGFPTSSPGTIYYTTASPLSVPTTLLPIGK